MAWIAEICGEGAAIQEAVALVVTELVSNVVRHGQGGPHGEVEVEIVPDGDGIVSLLVRDSEPGHCADWEPGIGLQLVEHFSRSVTVRSDGGGTVTRATFAY